jgi:hypothetical protein
MPRYYFHLCERTGSLPDHEGEEIANLDAARDIALKNARALIAADARHGVVDLTQRIEVRTAAGEVVHVLSFRDAVQLIV